MRERGEEFSRYVGETTHDLPTLEDKFVLANCPKEFFVFICPNLSEVGDTLCYLLLLGL